VLSHRSAASLWGIRATARTRIEVTVPGPRDSRPAIEVHRARLAPDETTTHRGIPVTTANRTLFDLAAILDPGHLERTLNEAEILRLTAPVSLDDLMQRHPRRQGTKTLRRILAKKRLGTTITRSELETRFLQFLDDAVLARPKVNANVEIGGSSIEADCIWPSRRLIVELDGHATHATAAGFGRDRARDRALHADGWRVVRITWRQLHEEPAAVAREVERLRTE
jgi:very-short-patch-repair endonuclease